MKFSKKNPRFKLSFNKKTKSLTAPVEVINLLRHLLLIEMLFNVKLRGRNNLVPHFYQYVVSGIAVRNPESMKYINTFTLRTVFFY